MSAPQNLFTTIPTRVNGAAGGTVQASWWNVLRTGLLQMFGLGAVGEGQITLTNNAGATAVTGVTCDSALYRTLIVDYDIYRKTDTAASELRATGRLVIQWSPQNSSWNIASEEYVPNVAHGVTWTLTGTTVVQLNYASSNLAGANYVGTLDARASTFAL
jgi:hypothetical protein